MGLRGRSSLEARKPRHHFLGPCSSPPLLLSLLPGATIKALALFLASCKLQCQQRAMARGRARTRVPGGMGTFKGRGLEALQDVSARLWPEHSPVPPLCL